VTLVIREAVETDLPAVLALYRHVGDPESLPIEEARRIFARFGKYPDYRLFVAERDGAVVGTYALLIMDNLGHLGAKSGVIEDVIVDPAVQGKGIGKAMMAHAIDECRAKDCYKAALSSNLKREAAHAFYDSLGFERHGYSFRVAPGDVR
jgi:ribosomal protein S18 acetylase RimI-like enzyme